MNIIAYTPYIKGELFMTPKEDYKAPYRATASDFQKWSEMLAMDEMSQKALTMTENCTEFFKVCKDIAHFVKPVEREEMFYSLKNGFSCPVVPAKLIYLVKKAYDMYHIPSLILRMLPKEYLEEVFVRSYIAGGFTMQDVIQNFCCKEYQPLSTIHKKVKYSDFYEIYIEETDMVACVPIDIGDLLKPEEIDMITVDHIGLKLHDNTYVANLSGYRGACNSIYDLRKLM